MLLHRWYEKYNSYENECLVTQWIMSVAKQEHLVGGYMMQAAMHPSNQIKNECRSWDVYITRENACMDVTADSGGRRTGLETDRTRGIARADAESSHGAPLATSRDL